MHDREYPPAPPTAEPHWTDWFERRLGWTVLLAGGMLCAVAVLLS